jgi:hypothetical protein
MGLLALGFLCSLAALTSWNILSASGQAVTELQQATSNARVADKAKPAKPQLIEAYAKLPLSFEANQGQTGSEVKFLSRGAGYNLFLTATEAVLALNKPAVNSDRKQSLAPMATLRMKLVGGNAAPPMAGLEKLSGKANYFIGSDPKQWRANVPSFAKVKYSEVYPGVDLIYYGNQRQLEYDLIVAPRVDPRVIKLSFDGARDIRIDRNGNLILKMDGGEVRQDRPFVYQEVDGIRRPVAGRYTLNRQREVGFAVGQYDASRPLVIDPAISYSTYLGGSLSDSGLGIAVDASGIYVTGTTFSPDFPGAGVQAVNSGVYKTTNGGSSWNLSNSGLTDTNVRSIVIDPSNPTTLYVGNGGGVFKSVNGGSSWNAVNIGLTNLSVSALTLDPNNPATLYAGTGAGIAKSVDAGASWNMFGGSPTSAATIVIDPGNPSTLYATQLASPLSTSGIFKSINGGANWSLSNTGLNSNAVQALVIDPANPQILYAGGFLAGGVFKSTNGGGSWSATNTGLFGLNINGLAINPVTTTTLYAATGSGVFKSTNGGANWVSSNTGLALSPRTLKIDPVTPSTVYVSTNFGGLFKSVNSGVNWSSVNSGLSYGLVTTLAIDPTNTATIYAGAQTTTDIFVAKLNPAGDSLLYATYFGGTNSENSAAGIAVDSSGNAYLAGDTSSTDFPVTANAYQMTQRGAQDVFIAKLNASGTILYATYLGSPVTDLAADITVESSGIVYVSGTTNQSGSPFFPVTATAYQTAQGQSDAFITKLDTNAAGAAGLLYSTYLGGSGNDIGYGLTTDGAGNVYVAGYTPSTNFPTTPGAYQTSYAGSGDVFLTKLNTNAAGAASLAYSTYIGGSGDDSGVNSSTASSNNIGVALDANGNVYLAGATRSSNFPVTASAFQSTYGGNTDAFILKLNPAGAGAFALSYSTYLGGSANEQAFGIAVDAVGNAQVTGQTSSSNFPVQNAFQATFGGLTDAFVATLNPAANGAASLIYASYLGGAATDRGLSIALDNSNNAYVVGLTLSTNFPTVNPLQGDQPGQDAFVAKIAPGPNTPAGSNVTVQPIDPNTGVAPVTITFSNVIQSGITSLEIINSGPAPPLGFKLGNPAVYYELSTTAVFSGPVQVCINYTGINYSNESNLKLFHREGGVWVNRTVSLNTVSNVICASVTSFSPFAIFEEDNLPPTVNAGGPYSVNEGGSVVVNASGADPEGGSLSFAWDLDDNGSFETFGQSVTFSAVGLDGPGNRTIRAQVTDSGGLSATAVATVNLLNVMPTVGAINAPTNPVQANTLINASANFTDPGLLDTHTASWNWGDGNTSSGVVAEANGSGSASDEHTYSAAGVYTITLTLTDKDGAVAQAVFQYVVVYDPGAGFVTGGGWINSPSGAYAPNAALTGKANFGFVSKYQHGANAPSGNTQFNFHVANLNFQSTSYQWLVIAGAKAQYKGEGVINGGGSYGFMLTAVDGQLSGGGGVDKFRIKIWDKATGDIVYDNQTGAADDATPTLALGGGSIVIHKQ